MKFFHLKAFQKAAAVLMAAAVAMAACVSCESDSTLKRIKKNGGLRVGVCSCAADGDAPFLIDGGSGGLTGEPATKIAASFRTEVTFTRLRSADAYEKLMRGSVDCLWNCPPPAKEHVSSVRTIETGLYYRQVIMTTKKSKINRLADVKGKKLAVVSGSDAQAELHKASVMEGSLKEIVVCGTMQQVLEALASGAVHCAAVDEPQALYAAAGFKDAEFKYVDTPIAECGLVIVTRADDADLCAKIAEEYVSLSGRGAIRSLCEKYGLTGLLTSALKGNPAQAST